MAEGMSELDAEVLSQTYNIVAMVIFCCSRFICTFILRYLNAGMLLGILAVAACVFTCGVIFFQNIWGMYCLVAVSACMSLMFPTIYGIALENVESQDTSLGAAFLVMAIVGGAIMPPLQGLIIDKQEILHHPAVNISFILPLLSFAIITLYGFRTYRKVAA
jgi:FHS family L-fucose permease-like MFS transporter